MLVVIGCFLLGSAIIAFCISWQVKYVSPDFWSIVKYNAVIAPAIFVANVALSSGFIKSHSLVKNLPAMAVTQTMLYYLCLLIFTVLVLGDKVSPVRSLIGIGLMGAGIWIIKS